MQRLFSQFRRVFRSSNTLKFLIYCNGRGLREKDEALQRKKIAIKR